ncbi:GDP-mannose mannosyl hydrolase [Marinobacterium zhoushanense]|uniref:GDP-mannose mannosyl hydrolase n=1 Tax=Marinobacterium zhoushanense TaxID=1679163 RepID=A0ABQ1KPI6_9GAMM|nr:GDP-mannose mannosyl hydrolase [Marinobacterium zhoushanense]GGC06709.1 GDP-mannose mannosyl hydrolase [Marinobacterium zhoushanense]
MWIDTETFKTVVSVTPLVSIDLIVERADGYILLGQRTNRPAQGFWFVPGGRILKSEMLDDAFRRLTQIELGLASEREEARLLGVYEHFYQDSVFGDDADSPSTHYVVLGYHLKLDAGKDLEPPHQQHSTYRWWHPDEMHEDTRVHENSRAYLAAL